MLRSTVETVSAPSDKDISWLNPRPHSPAVYASCAALPPPHATLATGRLARPYPDRTCTGRSYQLTLAPSSTHPTGHAERPPTIRGPATQTSRRHRQARRDPRAAQALLP